MSNKAMKKKRSIVLFLFTVFLLFGSQSFLYGAEDYVDAVKQLSTLKTKFTQLKSDKKTPKENVEEIENFLTELNTLEGRLNAMSDIKEGAPDHDAFYNEIQPRLKQINNRYTDIVAAIAAKGKGGIVLGSPAPTPTPPPTGQTSKRLDDHEERIVKLENKNKPVPWGTFDLVMWGLIAAGILAVVGLAVWGVIHLRKNGQAEKAELKGQIDRVRARNNELSSKLDSFQKVVTDLSQKVDQQKSNINTLKQEIGRDNV